MFDWDDVKRHETLKKHGIDFVDAVEIFTQPFLRLPARSGAEIRELAVGYLNGKVIAVVFTLRDENIRIITARRARKDEREKYHAYVAERGAPDEKPN